MEKKDRKGGKGIRTFATSIPVDAVCGFKRGKMNGAEALAGQYQSM